MTSPILLFYLGGICNRLLGFSVFLIVVSTVLLFVFINLSLTNNPDWTPQLNTEVKLRFRKLLKWPVIAIFLLTAFVMFVPSSKTMYVLSGVYASKYVVQETELGSTLNSEAINVIKDIGKAVHKLAAEDISE